MKIPTPPPPVRPTRSTRKSVDYFKLNDGLDESAAGFPKQKKHKAYSSPPRDGPSATRQAARKRKNAPKVTEEMKLPDLVITTSDALNVGTPTDSMAKKPCTKRQTFSSVEPTGHDTCTTTDEEDAVEALLALGNFPTTSNLLDTQDENEQLMPIGNFNIGTDANPVEIKLGKEDVAKAIAEIPVDSRLRLDAPTKKVNVPTVVAGSSKGESTSGSESNRILKTPPPADNDTFSDTTSPNKGTLKVTKYGLRKNHQKTRSYKCQNCGIREKSVRELNNHHRQAHPPLLCSDCNKIFYVPSTYQMHLYEHQKDKKVVCDTCGQKFSFKGQLEQHKIVHRSIKTHKCMAKNCNRWFMRKADLKVHTATHEKNEYTCDHCTSFKTSLKKYWKEHMKGHDDVLPYACLICKKRFLYRQQVSRHKAKEHK